MYEYKVFNFENEDHVSETDFFENPVLYLINDLAKEDWEIQQIIPWEKEGYREYMVILKKRIK